MSDEDARRKRDEVFMHLPRAMDLDDTQAIDLNAPRLCPYCGIRPCMPGVLNCGPCTQNAYVQIGGKEWERKVSRLISRKSWWARLRRWFLAP